VYLRSAPRRNKDGTEVRYLQLTQNVGDRAAKRSKVQAGSNFGREDAANREALQRLVASVSRFLEPGKALAAAAGNGLEFTVGSARSPCPDPGPLLAAPSRRGC